LAEHGLSESEEIAISQIAALIDEFPENAAQEEDDRRAEHQHPATENLHRYAST
jgi:hypothetical protein